MTKNKKPDHLHRYATENRRNMTEAEKKLWHRLRNSQIAGAKFRRQHVIGAYIVDFYCHEHQLIIEVDGGQHAEQKKYDEARTRYLQKYGCRVIRFWDNEVFTQETAVLEKIRMELERG